MGWCEAVIEPSQMVRVSPISVGASMSSVRLEVTCPGCAEGFHVLTSEQGSVVACPHCAGWVDVPDVNSNHTGSPEREYERQRAEYERQQEDYKKQQEENVRQMEEAARQQKLSALQMEHGQRQIEERDRQDAKWNDSLIVFERLLARWDELADRASQLLNKLDR